MGEARDAEVAARAVAALSTRARTGATEDDVLPDVRIGVAEGEWARSAPVTAGGRAWVAGGNAFQGTTVANFGTAADEAADLAAMGAGRARRLKQSDITWACLFPVDETLGDFFEFGAEVPPPGVIYDRIVMSPEGEKFGRLAGVAELLTVHCPQWPLKLDLTPFTAGGGITTNYLPGSEDQGDAVEIPYSYRIEAGDDGRPARAYLSSGDTYGSMVAGKPAWQNGVIILSGNGWSDFYTTEVDPVRFPSRDRATQEAYQEYGLNVWPTEETALAPTSPYAREVARRKSLAVAAFSAGIGRWLEGIEVSLRRDDGALSDVVDTIELGNEMDGFWQTDLRTPAGRAAVFEVGRLFALIAGPIHARLPGMRFRTELHSWAALENPPYSNFDEKRSWIEAVLAEGMTAETAWWERVQRYQLQMDWHALGLGHPKPPRDVPVEEWLETCALANFQWPPRICEDTSGTALEVARRYALALETYHPIAATRLVNQVGWHFYHGNNTDNRGNEDVRTLYADHNRLAADVAATTGVASAAGFSVRVTVGEIGYHAHDPGDPRSAGASGGRWGAAYYSGASPVLQAAMLVRAVLTVVAAGGDSAAAFPFTFGALPSTSSYQDGYQFETWQIFSTMGIHNDVAEPGRTYAQGSDCWPRPAWYALRRLSWLLGASDSVSLVYHDRGVTVIQLDFASGISTAPDGAALRATWMRAFVMWVDQYADNVDLHREPGARGGATARVLLYDGGGGGFEHVSLIPDITPQTTSRCNEIDLDPFREVPRWCADENGFALIDPVEAAQPNPNWEWEGWANVLASVTPPPSPRRQHLWLTLRKVDPAGTPVVLAPLLLFTNAEFREVLS